MNHARLLICFTGLKYALLLGAVNAVAQTPTPILVADVNTGNGPITGSDPRDYARLTATQTVFSAFDPVHGRELWITDGATANTHLLADICPGSCSSNPRMLNVADALTRGVVYFSADDGHVGSELWKVTSAGVVSMVADINPGALGSQPSSMVFPNVSNITPGFFAATTAATGSELFKTDGTAAGTVLVKDIVPGPEDSSPSRLAAGLTRVYFSARTPALGSELYISDGSPAGTVLRSDIRPGPDSSSPNSFSQFINDTMLFVADDGVNGQELWITTPTTTSLLKDIKAGAGGSSPSTVVGLAGTVFFTANNATNNTELWTTDGTPAGTTLFKDLNTTGSGAVRSLTILNTGAGPRMVFAAIPTGSNSFSVFVSDGTVVGTVPIFNTGLANVSEFTVSGPFAFFENAGTNTQLFRTDATAAGTFLIRDFTTLNFPSPNIGTIAAVGVNRVMFSVNDAFNGQEPYVSGASVNSTALLANLAPDLGYGSPQDLTNVNGTLYFSAFSEATGRELWKVVDPASGAQLVADLVPGQGSSFPDRFVAFGNKLVFLVEGIGRDVYVSDGTPAGTGPLIPTDTGQPLSTGGCLTVLGNRLYFYASSSGVGNELWISDATPAGTHAIEVQPGPNSGNGFCFLGDPGFAMAGSQVLFQGDDPVLSYELFRTDGTTATLVRDIVPGPQDSQPSDFISFGNLACFSAFGVLFDNEPWCSDGTAQGTIELGDLNPGGASSTPRSFARVGTELVFSATSTSGRALWRTDGTPAGTAAAISPAGTSLIGFLTASPSGGTPGPPPLEHDGNNVYFPCFLGTSQFCIDDARPGHAALQGLAFANAAFGVEQLHVFGGGDALMSCWTTTFGRELCRYRAGVGLLDAAIVDLAPGAQSSSPDQITLAGDYVYFSADDGVRGRELWAVPLKDTIDRIFANDFD